MGKHTHIESLKTQPRFHPINLNFCLMSLTLEACNKLVHLSMESPIKYCSGLPKDNNYFRLKKLARNNHNQSSLILIRTSGAEKAFKVKHASLFIPGAICGGKGLMTFGAGLTVARGAVIMSATSGMLSPTIPSPTVSFFWSDFFCFIIIL
jgi:hypothetical protein